MALIKILDRIFGTMITLVLLITKYLSPKKEKPRKLKKILVIRLFGMGDAIILAPLLSDIKRKGIDITVMTTNETKTIFEMSGINEIYNIKFSPLSLIKSIYAVIKELKGKYDLIIDTESFDTFSSILTYLIKPKWSIGFDLGLRGQLYDEKIVFNPNQHTIFTFASILSKNLLKPVVRLTRFRISQTDRKYISTFLAEKRISKKDIVIGIHPGTGSSALFRRWMPERFAKVADALASRYKAKVILTGTKSEENLLNYISSKMTEKPIIITNFSLQKFAALMPCLDLFISNDTGPMHFAAAMDASVIGLFGPNTPIRWAPFNKNSVSIYKRFPCSPCINTHLGIVPEHCPLYSIAKCMEAIEVDDVFNAIDILLKSKH